MSGERTTFLRVGLLLLAGFALLAGFILFLGANRFGGGQEFETYFKESVQGLDVGTAVRYRGVTIGRVDKLGLVSAAYATQAPADLRLPIYRLVYVRFTIDRRLLGAVPRTRVAVAEGLRVRLSPQGITGLYYLELDFANPKANPPLAVPWTPKAAYIPSIPSTLTQVQDAAQLLLAKLDKLDLAAIVARVGAVIGAVQNEMRGGDLHRTLRAVRRLADTARGALRAADIGGISRQIRRTLGAARTLAAGPRTAALLTAAGHAAHGLARIAARLAPLVAALGAVTARADTTLAGIEAALAPTLRDLRATAAALRETSAALRRYPAGTLLGAPPPHDLGNGR